jgi:hypothetical protein
MSGSGKRKGPRDGGLKALRFNQGHLDAAMIYELIPSFGMPGFGTYHTEEKK